MPELPEVETVRLGLAKWVTGKTIIEAKQFHPRAVRGDISIKAFEGAKVKKINRRGKYLWFEFDLPEVLVAHLGMSGQFRIQPAKEPTENHLRASFTLQNGKQIRFIDQRTFGWLTVSKLINGIPQVASHIALDLFDEKFSMKNSVQKISIRKSQIKSVLLNQTIVSGIGNIYADEALWRAKIHPETKADSLTEKEITNLLKEARKVMALALKVGGTSFDDLYINVNGESGYFERRLAVYGREGEACRRCGREIQRIAFANRSSHLCPRCQKR